MCHGIVLIQSVHANTEVIGCQETMAMFAARKREELKKDPSKHEEMVKMAIASLELMPHKADPMIKTVIPALRRSFAGHIDQLASHRFPALLSRLPFSAL